MAIQSTTKQNKQIDFFGNLKAAQESCVVTTIEGELLGLREGLTCGIQLILSCHQNRKKLIFIGNGGSAAIASHMSIDYWKNGGIGAMAFNDSSLLTCISNDYGYQYVFEKPIDRFACEGDLLVAISSSGKSANILRAGDLAREKRCFAMTLSGFDASNPLRSKGHINFYIPSHSYGIVEVNHLAILHAMLDEIIESRLVTISQI